MPKKVQYPWYYNGTPLQTVPEGYVGFVYLITYTGNKTSKQYYIGKKHFYSTKTVRPTKKELLNKPKSRPRKVTTESNWKQYFGSNQELKKLVSQEDSSQFTRVILCLCRTKRELTYMEVEYLVKHNVLRKQEYFNDNVLGKFFRRDLV